jgi:aryl-alcohol dehydrogenase-like predicted oxidoreductase
VRYRALGGTDLEVSVISLGALTFGGSEAALGLDLEQSRRVVDTAIDAGVNLFDTADVYGKGESESILGETLKGRRDKVVVATKVGAARTEAGQKTGEKKGVGRREILEGIDGSLRRLQTDYIDLYQLHLWDGKVSMEDTFATLEEARDAGKIRHFGCSNYSARQLYRSSLAASAVGSRGFVSHEINYSLLSREAERELIPTAVDLGMSTLVWGPLAGGLLTGKYRRDSAWPDDARHNTGWTEPPYTDWSRVYDIIEGLVAVAEEEGRTPAQVALAFVLQTPTVASVTVGAKSPRQLEDSLVAGDYSLPTQQRDRLLDLTDSYPLPYPFWHQLKSIRSRASETDLIALGFPRE